MTTAQFGYISFLDPFSFIASKDFTSFNFSNLSIVSVPDDGYRAH